MPQVSKQLNKLDKLFCPTCCSHKLLCKDALGLGKKLAGCNPQGQGTWSPQSEHVVPGNMALDQSHTIEANEGTAGLLQAKAVGASTEANPVHGFVSVLRLIREWSSV